MNDESADALDRLLGDWAAAREADEGHTQRLADQILAAAREQPDVADGGRDKPAQFWQEPSVEPLPQRRNDLFRPASSADWGTQLMIGGGGLLLLLILVGCVLYYNLTTATPGNPLPTVPLAGATGSPPLAASDPTAPPAAASLGAAVLAAKQQLLAETIAVFDDQLAWIVDGERDVAVEVSDHQERDGDKFMLVRVVVAQRTSPDAPWSTKWQADVISRSEALVRIAPQRFGGSSLALWTYLMPDGEVAVDVDMDLMLDHQTPLQSSSSVVVRAGQPARVGCTTEDGIERCVFQTVMPLNPSPS